MYKWFKPVNMEYYLSSFTLHTVLATHSTFICTQKKDVKKIVVLPFSNRPKILQKLGRVFFFFFFFLVFRLQFLL